MSSGVDRLFAYARERYLIFLRRQGEGQDHPQGPPWTEDPVLQQFRFCNVFREDDRVTRWMRDNLTSQIPPWDKERHFMAAVVFRWFNKIETGELLRPLLLGNWGTEEARALLKMRVATGRPILGAAYMIKSPLRMNKVDGLLQCIDAVRRDIVELATHIDNGKTELQGVHEVLCDYPYLGPFMAYEMVTDMRHSPLLDQAPDIMTWASAGPGAARGLCRVADEPLGSLSHNNPEHRRSMNISMSILLSASRDSRHWPSEWPQWEMREVEHTLCEFDKYERARLGEGRPKQRFNGGVS